jgi:hypothetical protein
MVSIPIYFWNQGKNNPDTRQMFIQDLTKLINTYNQAGDNTILLFDANDTLLPSNSLISALLCKTQLTSLIPHPMSHPATHARGSKYMDFIFGSPNLCKYVTSAGITTFYDPPCAQSNHQTLLLDIETIALFGAKMHTVPPQFNKN